MLRPFQLDETAQAFSLSPALIKKARAPRALGTILAVHARQIIRVRLPKFFSRALVSVLRRKSFYSLEWKFLSAICNSGTCNFVKGGNRVNA